MTNNTAGRVGPPMERPPEDAREFFHGFLENGGLYDWSYWDHIQSWWEIHNTPNVLLVHFNDLKADMEGGIRRIAEFLDIEIDEERWPDIIEHFTFDYMKKNANSLLEHFPDMFEGGLTKFVYKGTNGRWRDGLTSEENEKYERIANSHLTPDCAHWHATGEMPD